MRYIFYYSSLLSPFPPKLKLRKNAVIVPNTTTIVINIGYPIPIAFSMELMALLVTKLLLSIISTKLSNITIDKMVTILITNNPNIMLNKPLMLI